MHKRWAIALLGATVLMPALSAQMLAPGMSPPAQTALGTGFTAGRGASITFNAHPHLLPQRAFFLGTPYWYSDYATEPVVVQAPPPQVVVVQAPAAAEVSEAGKPGPLLIEWRGDRYVRVTGAENDPARARHAQPDYSEESASRHAVTAAPAPATQQELPPAVLVFRDGRQEEVRDYAIVSGVMYVRGDYWQKGSWTRQIQLSSLDVPATLQANQQRGVKFLLPSGPNEVVTRP
jgi:hypothetical protein